nr:reverse transcriptase domain-containing protein [Tanacetum cinerariifolium]
EWDRYKDLLRACSHHGFTELHKLDTFYNALNPADQDSLNAFAGGNLLERRTQDVLTIIENKFKVRNSRNKSVVSQVKSFDANSNSFSEIAKLTHAVNQQMSAVTTTMTDILKQFQATPPPAFVKAVEEICVTCGGAHPYYHWSGSLPGNTITNSKGELKAITTRSGIVLNGPTVPTPPPVINPKEVDERVEDTLTNPDLSEYTIKVPPTHVQKYKPPSQRDFVVHLKDPFYPNIPYPLRMLKQKQQEKDEVQIYKFWQMFKQLHINITLADALILRPKYQKMLKALLSNKEKLQELANTPLNENCSSVILKKLLEKHGDLGKFLIPYGFNELKCKALADLGASINLMPLYVWKKLGLAELIFARMTIELANRAICTPARIARDVFVPVGKFTFPADSVIVDYESDLIVPLILRRPFLRTVRALIDAYGEEMILRDARCTTYSSSPNPLLEELADELALITFPPKYDDDLQFDIESDLKEIEFLLHQDIDSSLKDSIDQSNLVNPADNYVDSMPEMFTDEHAPDYSSPLIFDEYDDDFESDTKNVYDDPFDSKGEKIKESKLLIDELDLPCDFLPSSEYDPFISQDFSRVDALPSTNNEDKVFNPGILSQENPFEIITRVIQDKKLATSNAFLVLEDFDHPFYKPFSSKKFPS